jgi:hypothetical protein
LRGLRSVTVSGEDRGVTPPEVLSPARRALVDYAERSPGTQADLDRVMRALVAHDDWYVPVEFAELAWGQSTFDHKIRLGNPAQSAVINVFTDQESALLATGQPIGHVGGPVTGSTLMQALDDEITALIVNPASPREQQWYIAAAGFEIAATWGTAIEVERALARRGAGPVPVAELLAHRYQILLERQGHALAQVYLPEIDGAVAVCFTASDRAEEFLASLPPVARPLAEITPIAGEQLFETMRGVHAAGLVVNAGSDDQTALTRDDIAEVSHLRR